MNRKVPEVVKDFSLGALKNTTDMVLFLLAFGIGLGVSGRSTRGVHRAVSWAEGVNVDSIRRALDQLKSKGWIKRDLHLTREGQKRLMTFVPESRKYPKRWKGVWHLISFDIPERIAWKRSNLRTTLRRLGFGKLHESLWISPYNFLGDVQAYCKAQQLHEYVLPATSKEVGTRMSRELADKVWGLSELNSGYAQWITRCKEGSSAPERQFELIFEYSALLRRDLFLPGPLLPVPWYGKRAHMLFKKIDQSNKI